MAITELVATIVWVYSFVTPAGTKVTMGYTDGISSQQCSSLVSYDRWDGRPRTAYNPVTRRCAVMVVGTKAELESINASRD